MSSSDEQGRSIVPLKVSSALSGKSGKLCGALMRTVCRERQPASVPLPAQGSTHRADLARRSGDILSHF